MTVFLATTANEAFWDTSRPLAFLGEWCTLYARRDYWRTLGGTILPDPWQDLARVEEAHSYCTGVYKSAVSALTEALNGCLGLRKPEVYYEIILGNWLLYYIHQLYDKYVCLKAALARHPDLTTCVLEPAQHCVPADLADMASRLSRDDYALEQYSQLLETMGYRFPTRRLPEVRQAARIDLNGGLKPAINRGLAAIGHLLNGLLRRRSFVVTQASLPRPLLSRLRLLLASGGRIVPDDFASRVSVAFVPDMELRRSVSPAIGEDEFCGLLSRLLLRNIPAAYLEAHLAIAEQVRRASPSPPAVLCTALGMHFNLPFKFYAAEHYGRYPLAQLQYGGGYCTDAFMSVEDWERSIASVYYSWGRTEPAARHLPHPKLLSPVRRPPGKPRALLVMTTWSRFQYRFECHPTGHNFSGSTLRLGIEFCRALRPEVNVAIRRHPLKYGWSIERRYADAGVRVAWDTEKSLRDSVRHSSICVFDHLGTGYVETLAWDVPTLIFVDRSQHKFRPAARPFFDRLERAGILHYSAGTAADLLNRVHGDVQSWWRQPEVREARDAFVSNLALTSPDWMAAWLREFERLAAGSGES